MVSSTLITYILIGFFAQLVDGALGMAYGTLSTAVLLATGMPPVTVSAGVHMAQFFTSGLSGISHTLFKNVDWKLFTRLVIAGICGGILGAMLLTKIDGDAVRPWIASYLLVLGLFILRRVSRKKSSVMESGLKRTRFLAPIIGAVGGFLDAIGGGWGPIVTSSLMLDGHAPRYAIGSVNTAEFFVKTAVAMTFLATIGLVFQEVVLGLLIGGVLAAPLGAFILRVIKPELLMTLVGCLIIVLSLYQISQAVF